MDAEPSRKQIGLRIAELRKLKGLSQEDLAQRLELSRSSLTQIELGNRSVDVFELQRIAKVFGVSMDELMSRDFSVKSDAKYLQEDKGSGRVEERISVPTLHVGKFRNVLLYLLERCAGKPNVGETVLYKLLYFCDFNHYEMYEEHLTGATYRKLPYGPVPYRMDAIVHDMIERKQLQRIRTEYHGFTQTRYLPLVKPDLSELRASEKEIMDCVIGQMSDWSAAAISDYSHRDMPWLASRDGEVIDYELAFYRETPFSVRNYGDGMEEQ